MTNPLRRPSNPAPERKGGVKHFHLGEPGVAQKGFGLRRGHQTEMPCHGRSSFEGPFPIRTLAVAEGFFVQPPGADKAGLRNFTVNRPVDSNPPPPEPSPQIESFTIRDGMVTLKINKVTKRYNVQFSTDRVNWTTIAANQTAATWKGSLPTAPAGFFQVVKS